MNRTIHIATAGSRKSMHWPTTEMSWLEFAEKLKTPIRSSETYQEYIDSTKAKQAQLKDVGGFVGGTFKPERRKAAYAQGRDLITLDLDSIPSGKTDDVLKRVGGLGCAAVIYSTRKHHGFQPRLRVIIPTDRTVSPDEYEPIARKMGHLIGMDMCDPTTFEVSRLMYWPSVSSDGEYVYQLFDKSFMSADGILAMYEDWHDYSAWPQVPGIESVTKRDVAKQADPYTKKGIVGAFCRAYSIEEAMDKYIPDLYAPTKDPNRYTFTGGSTAGGAIIYDGKFLYSHHATDPCSGQLVNAFDLIRLHKFADHDLEAKEGTPVVRMPSYTAMIELARQDDTVAHLMAKERHEEAAEAFGSEPITAQAETTTETDWHERLTLDGNGNIKKTINNAVVVLENDPALKDKIVVDEFASCGLTLGGLPWDPEARKRRWTDADDAGLYNYMELFYGITGRDKIDNALLIVANKHRINEVKDYLLSLTWDGKNRIDTLLPDYLGAEDNEYTRAVMRVMLTGAVARAIEGGVKFDYMAIITGPQGIGKSSFLSILGKEWFSDSLTTFSGKEAAELIQGTWINEIGELTAFSKQENQIIKQFLSKTDDIYRAAYGRRTTKYPRRCVFFGTSNESNYLRDVTGGRRFLPVEVGLHPETKSVWDDLPREVDQIWAEAMVLYQLGAPIYLDKKLEKLAEVVREDYQDTSAKEGAVRDFLDMEIPENWGDMDLMQRRQFYNGNLALPEGTKMVHRETVCVAEIWQECFESQLKFLRRQDSNEITAILERQKGWKKEKKAAKVRQYGTQKVFRRIGIMGGNELNNRNG